MLHAEGKVGVHPSLHRHAHRYDNIILVYYMQYANQGHTLDFRGMPITETIIFVGFVH